jgi:hypothetical protein
MSGVGEITVETTLKTLNQRPWETKAQKVALHHEGIMEVRRKGGPQSATPPNELANAAQADGRKEPPHAVEFCLSDVKD